MKQGNALSDDKGPSLGRGMGVGSTMDERNTSGPLSQQAMKKVPGMQVAVEHPVAWIVGKELNVARLGNANQHLLPEPQVDSG